MKALGLDIGTTTISAVVVEDRRVTASRTLPNGSFWTGTRPWEKLQDPEKIRETALKAVKTLLEDHPDVRAIGVTGQMHGIVYLDEGGTPVSPLYTWQDGRGDLPYEDGLSYAQYLSRLTGCPAATGFGFVTHFYNLKNGLVPENAKVFCTIHDYIAMLLAGKTAPVTDVSDAASFGLFRVAQREYDWQAIEKSGMDRTMVPPVANGPILGLYEGRIPVCAAIGDNQASFLGATSGTADGMVLNVGTGGQFSVYSQDYLACPGLETRPFPGKGFLLAGSSLCGGRAYALLEGFARDAVEAMTGLRKESCYGALDALLGEEKPEDIPVTVPLFQGTREDPTLRGSITGLTTENFTLRHLAWSMLEGMAKELHDLYLCYQSSGGEAKTLIGSGNGLRKNPCLQRCCREIFGMPLSMAQCQEEAAAGAALYALSTVE